MSVIEISLGAARHPLTLPEAESLGDLLIETGSPAGQTLARLIREEVETPRPQGIRLGLDDISALRSVLCETELSGAPGLEGLQSVLCEAS